MGVIYTNWAEDSHLDKGILEKKINKLKLDVDDEILMKNQNIKDFSEAASLGLGDYITLILKMANLPNPILKFVNLLFFIESHLMTDEIKQMYHKLINTLLEMIRFLEEAIMLLRENPNGVIYNINEIYELESSTNTVFQHFLYYLYQDKDFDVKNLLILRESIAALEQLVDKIHHIAEIVRILRYE
ncbi:MAG: hypothetical protein ACFFC9_16750 [Promethearchaeota archaeon]